MKSEKTPDTTSPTPWMDTERAAAYLGCSPGTLRVWRATGKGPRYGVIHGKTVRYHIDDIDGFLIRRGGGQTHAVG